MAGERARCARGRNADVALFRLERGPVPLRCWHFEVRDGASWLRNTLTLVAGRGLAGAAAGARRRGSAHRSGAWLAECCAAEPLGARLRARQDLPRPRPRRRGRAVSRALPPRPRPIGSGARRGRAIPRRPASPRRSTSVSRCPPRPRACPPTAAHLRELGARGLKRARRRPDPARDGAEGGRARAQHRRDGEWCAERWFPRPPREDHDAPQLYARQLEAGAWGITRPRSARCG